MGVAVGPLTLRLMFFFKNHRSLFSMFENYVVLVVLNIPNTVEFAFH